MTISKIGAVLYSIVLLIAGAFIGDLGKGVFSGAGLDPDRIGREIGAQLVGPNPIETSSTSLTRDPRTTEEELLRERERIKQEVTSARLGAKKATKTFELCIADAQQSLLKMWDPEAHCAEEKLLMRAAQARYDAWK